MNQAAAVNVFFLTRKNQHGSDNGGGLCKGDLQGTKGEKEKNGERKTEFH